MDRVWQILLWTAHNIFSNFTAMGASPDLQSAFAVPPLPLRERVGVRGKRGFIPTHGIYPRLPLTPRDGTAVSSDLSLKGRGEQRRKSGDAPHCNGRAEQDYDGSFLIGKYILVMRLTNG